MMKIEPRKEHRWLQKLVGEWTSEAGCAMGPDQTPSKMKGTETVRSLGGLWIVGEGRAQMPDGEPATMLLTLGFDPERERFVGTWVGSMMTHLWVYDGELDRDGRKLTLAAEGPGCTPEGATKLTKFRDVIELKNDDHRVLTSYMLGDDGKWSEFMTAHYHRKK